MAFMYGYGVMTDDKWATVDNILSLLGKAPKYKAEVMPDIQDWLDEKGVSDIHEIDPSTAVSELLSIMEDTESNESGIHVILSRVIEEAEGIKLVATSDDDCWPFLVLDICCPWNYEPAIKELTEERMDEIFREYIEMVTEEVVEIGHHFI